MWRLSRARDRLESLINERARIEEEKEVKKLCETDVIHFTLVSVSENWRFVERTDFKWRSFVERSASEGSPRGTVPVLTISLK